MDNLPANSSLFLVVVHKKITPLQIFLIIFKSVITSDIFMNFSLTGFQFKNILCQTFKYHLVIYSKNYLSLFCLNLSDQEIGQN